MKREDVERILRHAEISGSRGYLLAQSVPHHLVAHQPAVCPKCDGTGEADSGGIHPWGAPATIPCDCQQPAAVDAQ